MHTIHDPLAHGGPDEGLPIAWDFSSNANPLPLPEHVRRALQGADRRRYPDPRYTALRGLLADHWGTAPDLVLPTAGSSEAIRRLTLAAHLRGVREAWVPHPGYGDYRAAAVALGLRVRAFDSGQALLRRLGASRASALVWLCEPCNPTGQSLPASFWQNLAATMHAHPACMVALDRAYEPLRLEGTDPVPPAVARHCWQLWSPNKALGLTGVRAGALLAPDPTSPALLDQLRGLAPSWVLSAEGIALWQAWCDAATPRWLAACRHTLLGWRAAQQALLDGFGWAHQPSVTPFFVSRPPDAALADAPARGRWLQVLRHQGIKLRDAQSLGLDGWLRLSAQGPDARDALRQALSQAWRDAA